MKVNAQIPPEGFPGGNKMVTENGWAILSETEILKVFIQKCQNQNFGVVENVTKM